MDVKEEPKIRVGLVGVGRWGKTLGHAFMRCGADVVAYDRRTDDLAEGFGRRQPWRTMLPESIKEILEVDRSGGDPLPRKTEELVDVIVSAADPSTTAEVAEAALDSWTPAFITKPLLKDPRTASNDGFNIFDGQAAPYMVDFWRLWSPSWRMLKTSIENEPPEKVVINLYGDGPVRSYSGAHDYGPHVFAFLQNLFQEWRVETYQVSTASDARCLVSMQGRGSIKKGGAETQFVSSFGNGGNGVSDRRVAVTFADKTRLLWIEDSQFINFIGRSMESREPKLRGLDLQVKYFLSMAKTARKHGCSFWSPSIQIACQATTIIDDMLAGRPLTTTKSET